MSASGTSTPPRFTISRSAASQIRCRVAGSPPFGLDTLSSLVLRCVRVLDMVSSVARRRSRLVCRTIVEAASGIVRNCRRTFSSALVVEITRRTSGGTRRRDEDGMTLYTTALWFYSVMVSLVFGAGIYEIFVVHPAWSRKPPESIVGFVRLTGDPAAFWVPVTPLYVLSGL